ncbi:9221_t:CDS:2 [Paraglomus occultum]|uniref:9221_t:CDS:1 n=1 Tax=Paraglomus occultum TaxID=144539 RepID=A0A9N9GN88_9GLOM|nr:9221_t:CDS:2 [Paraglomus occultum]
MLSPLISRLFSTFQITPRAITSPFLITSVNYQQIRWNSGKVNSYKKPRNKTAKYRSFLKAKLRRLLGATQPVRYWDVTFIVITDRSPVSTKENKV